MEKRKNTRKNKTAWSIRFFLCFLTLTCLISLSADSLFAEEEPSGSGNEEDIQDSLADNQGYSFVLYDNTNGLPTSEANDIAQTSEGFIWIGSYGGLTRYDGNSFVRMDSTTGITSVSCLFVDSKNRLWVGTNDNGVFLMENGTFRSWDEDDGLKSSSIRSVIEDNNGNIYIGTSTGLATIDTDMKLHSPQDARLAYDYISDLQLGKNNTVWGVTNEGNLFICRDLEVEKYIVSNQNPLGFISCFLVDPNNPEYAYIETDQSELFYTSPYKDLEDPEKIDISPLSQVSDIEYVDGIIWICTRNGIGMLDTDGEFYDLTEVPMRNSVNHVIKDYEGNLWFTSSRQGVMKIVRNRFSNIFDLYDIDEAVVNSTCMYDHMLFVATDSGLTVISPGKVMDEIPLSQAVTASGKPLDSDDLIKLLNDCRIRSIIRDSQDRLWLSTWRKYGLICYDHGSVTAYTVDDGILSEHMRAVCERKDGSILAAGTGGVSEIKDGKIIRTYTEKDGILNKEILTVTESFDGNDILLGSDGDGIYIIGKDGEFRHIAKHDGLISGAVMRIKKDHKRNIYWIITGSSICYLTEDYKLHAVSQFPYSNNFDFYQNSRDEMWILSSNGIHVCQTEDMLGTDEIKPIFYGIQSGLPCISTANSYSELTPNGDLYLAGNISVTKVNVEADYQSAEDMRAAVPYVDIDGYRIYPDENGEFQIPADVKKLTIYGYILSYSLVNPQISYQLKGFDREATTVRKSEFQPVTYTNLPGNTYSFIMRMTGPMDEEDKVITVKIIKKKAFYEYTGFYVTVILFTLLFITETVRQYIDTKMDKLEKQHKEENERERIRTEMNMANRIQISMLPHIFPPFPDRNEFEIYASMDPAKEVGGDFYDFFLIDDDHLCMVMADVSGKGVPGALFMMVSKIILKSIAMLSSTPAEILTKTNDALCADNTAEMFVTVWLGILEISTGRITASNAGHEYPAVMHDKQFSLLKDKHGFILGGMEGCRFTDYEIKLEPGDKLFLYTDGVPEATRADNSMFGTDRMLEALNSDPEAAPKDTLKNVREAVDSFVKDAEPFDDLTMLCIEYFGPNSGKQS